MFTKKQSEYPQKVFEVWINFLISVARGVGIRLRAGMRSSAWSLMDGCGTLGILGVCSDLDQKRAFFWSKSELETPEVTIQLCNNMGALSVGMLF